MAEQDPEVAALEQAIRDYAAAYYGDGVVTGCVVIFEMRTPNTDPTATAAGIVGYTLPGQTTAMTALGLAAWAQYTLARD